MFARKDRNELVYGEIADIINFSVGFLTPKMKASQIEFHYDFQKDLLKIPMKVQNIQQVIIKVKIQSMH
ncbi:MAG: hypothetical protein ACFFD2_09300 [Promethearchaeota archaeon]